MRPFIVGTAGHIDHGKSALVRALTGIDPDRLPEEKRRGITIELGFAHAKLAPGVEAAFVDVPGHERFVRTMVAGAHGVDVVLFVVAADEGIMPQTREHADICRLLDLPQAVVALTKSDLLPDLDPDWPALVEDDIRALGAPFATAPIVRVSARTGAGLPELRNALVTASQTLPVRPENQPPFLPIDRVFTVKGHGTVVTGSLLSGAIAVDETLDLIIPGLRKAKVTTGLRARSLQVHGRAVDRAVAGQRVAVNLPGIDVADIPRGSALSGAGTGVYRQGPLIDAEVELVPGARPLPNRGRLTLHLGTAQALATVDLLGRSELEPGERVVAQLRLDRALPAVRNQRFVLRGYRGLAHGGRTAAGGRILLVDQRRRRKADQPLVEGLRGEPGDAAAVLIREAGLRGIDPMALRLLLALPAKGKLGPRTTVEAGGKLFDRDALVEARTRLADIIRERETLPREEARAWLGPAVSPAVFDAVVAALGSGFVAGEVLSVAERVRDATEVRLEGILLKAALTPPTAGELADATTLDRQAVGTYLRNLVKAGLAVRLTDDLFVHAAPAADFRRRAVEALKERGSLTTLELKEMSGASRKFAIPLCEWLDREHVTVRVGEKRTLRGGGK